MSKSINNISEISNNYNAFIIDLWGVIHDGTNLYEKSLDCLKYLRSQNKKILFLSNSPKRAIKSVQFLESVGVTNDLYDHVLTSGEFFFQNLQKFAFGTKFFHLGPNENNNILDNSYLINTNLEDCDFILSTGLIDYRRGITSELDILNRAIRLNLPMICINPDIIVITTDGEEYLCAGAIAEEYKKLSGKISYTGKPYSEIYEQAQKIIGISKSEIIAIGDSLRTDITGATNFGIDNILVTSGIHLNEQKDLTVNEIFIKYKKSPNYYIKLFQ